MVKETTTTTKQKKKTKKKNNNNNNKKNNKKKKKKKKKKKQQQKNTHTKNIELQCKQNILNKTICFYGINSTYLLQWQHKFLCHDDFVHKFVFQYLTTIMLLITLFSDCCHEIYKKNNQFYNTTCSVLLLP